MESRLHPIWQNESDEYREYNESDDDCGGDVIGKDFAAVMHDIYDDDFGEQLHSQIPAAHSWDEITWCTEDRRAWSEDHAIATYGNEPTSTIVYNAAAILLHVPPWAARDIDIRAA